jgi:hypothetical protein
MSRDIGDAVRNFIWGQPPGEERRCSTQDLVLLLQEPDPLPGLPELRRFLLRQAWTGAVLDVGLLKPVVQSCFGNPKVFGDLRDWGFMLPCHGDHVTAELSGERLRLVNSLAARSKSSQVRSQANPGQSHPGTSPTVFIKRGNKESGTTRNNYDQDYAGCAACPVPGRPKRWSVHLSDRSTSRSDGGAATTFYVKESGTGNMGWIAK